VVLVDFWTLTCINWLRTEPYVRAWSQAYRNDGLVVIGVHTPEFSFEHEIDRVRQATKERAIDYPIAVDNDYEVWSAFDNHYWPALYFVDADVPQQQGKPRSGGAFTRVPEEGLEPPTRGL
jgi:thiol-disulfide isomerase/thioredoxin